MKKILSIIMGLTMIISAMVTPCMIFAEGEDNVVTESFSVDFGGISAKEYQSYKDLGVVYDGLTTGYATTSIDHNGIILTNARPANTSNYSEYIDIRAEKVVDEYNNETNSMLTQAGFKGNLNISFRFQLYNSGGQYRMTLLGIKDDGTIVNTDYNSGSARLQIQSYGYVTTSGVIASLSDIGTSKAELNVTLDTVSGQYTMRLKNDGTPVGTEGSGLWGECGEDVAFYGIRLNPTSCNVNQTARVIALEELIVTSDTAVDSEDAMAVRNAADAISNSDFPVNLEAMSPQEFALPALESDSDVNLSWSSSDSSLVSIADSVATVSSNTSSTDVGKAWLSATFTKGTVKLTKKFKVGVLSSLLYKKDISDADTVTDLMARGILINKDGNLNSVDSSYSSGNGIVNEFTLTRASYTFGNAYADYYFKDFNEVYSDETRTETWTNGYAGNLNFSIFMKNFNGHTYQIYLLMADADGNICVQAANAEPCIKLTSAAAPNWTFNGTTIVSARNYANLTYNVNTLTGAVTCTAGSAVASATLPYYGEGYKLIGFRVFAYGSTASGRIIGFNNIKITRAVEDADDTSVRGVANILTGEYLGVNLNCVSDNITLPTTVNGASVSWASENTDVIGNDGTVTIPEEKGTSTDACLVATITKGNHSMCKRFYVTVVNPDIQILNITPDLSAGNVSYTLANKSPDVINGDAYLASYADNTLVGISIQELKGIEFGDSKDIVQNLNLSATPELVKLIVVDKNLKPYIKDVEYDVSQ